MPVHLYGIPCDMDALAAIARQHDLKVIEDAAEAIGTRTNGHHVGHQSDAATFSFFGNKTITCGEGGMIITNDASLAENMRITKNHGMSTSKRYWHDRFGVNYRMTNLQAAIGTAQLEQLPKIMTRKADIYRRYRDGLVDQALTWQALPEDGFESNYWLVSFLAPSSDARDAIANALDEKGIETRPLFHCAHVMPPYLDTEARFPVAEDISARGMSLPSFPDLQDNEIDEIIEIVSGTLQHEH